jgi:hypothetical protein
MITVAPPYKYDLPSIGDVVLCRGASKASGWNIAGQRMVRWAGPVHFSHVALQLYGFVLHAMPGKGVHAISTLHLLLRCGLRHWRVYRHKSRDIPGTAATVGAGMELIVRAQYLIGQSYNKKFLLPKFHAFMGHVDENAFCSELICHLYGGTRIREAIRRRRATSVLPADIERAIAGSKDWIDVTPIYKQHISDCSAGGMIDKWIEREQLDANVFEKLALVQAKIAKTEVDAHNKIQAFHVVEDRLRRQRGLPRRQRSIDDTLVKKLETFNWKVAKAGAAGRRHLRSLRRKLKRR